MYSTKGNYYKFASSKLSSKGMFWKFVTCSYSTEFRTLTLKKYIPKDSSLLQLKI